MIQFNLLPDVKLQYIKARRTKHLVMLGSFLFASVTVSVAVILAIGVHGVQKRHIDNLSKDIGDMSTSLKKEEGIDKILTVQNQLNSLGALHDAKPAADRLDNYLEQVTPSDVAIATLNLNFASNTIEFEGKAKSLKNVNEFIDTLKFTTYEYKETEESTEKISKTAFSNVVLAQFDRTDSEDAMSATYKITLNFDPLIFDIKINPRMRVPNQITTRSVTERPAPLFQEQPAQKEEDQ